MPLPGKKKGFSFPITALVGSSVPNFVRIRKDYHVDRTYLSRYVLTVLLAGLLEPLRWWEDLAWNRRIARTELPVPPVFIIGFWRSGTTMLHEMLCLPKEASYVTTFQTVFPHQVLSQAWWLKPLANNMMPAKRPFDNLEMSLDYPQEEEIAMACTQRLSFYSFFYFPRMYETVKERDLFFRAARKEDILLWRKEYLRLMRKAMLNTGGKRFISKNPSNMVRIPLLLDMFPDAKFIFIHRDPYHVVESFHGFLESVMPPLQLQKPDSLISREEVAHLFFDMVNFYESHKHLVPKENLFELKYEDLVKEPDACISNIYKKFNIEGFNADFPLMKAYLERSRDLKKNHYEISGKTIACVNRLVGDFIKRWGYEVKS